MNVEKSVSAGVYGKNDVKISICPADELIVEIQSPVKCLYGEEMEQSIRRMLQESGICGAKVTVEDKGALSWVMEARLEAAIALLKEG